MSGKAKGWMIVVVVLLAAVGGLFVLARDTRTDEVQIKSALDQSIQASREGRAGGVLDLLSDQLKVNGIGNVNKKWIAEQVRANKPEVTFKNQRLQIDGDTAEMTADVTVTGKLKVMAFEKSIDASMPGVKLTFRKESVQKFLIVPSTAWKLEEVKLPRDLPIDVDM